MVNRSSFCLTLFALITCFCTVLSGAAVGAAALGTLDDLELRDALLDALLFPGMESGVVMNGSSKEGWLLSIPSTPSKSKVEVSSFSRDFIRRSSSDMIYQFLKACTFAIKIKNKGVSLKIALFSQYLKQD
jgi:hypothetical protein